MWFAKANGQIIAGQGAVGIRVDTINSGLASPSDSTLFKNISFNCDNIYSIELNTYYWEYYSIPAGSTRKYGFSKLRLIDSNLEVPFKIDTVFDFGINKYFFTVLKLYSGNIITDSISNSWVRDTTFLLSSISRQLSSIYDYGFSSKFIPIRKKYGNEYLYGWINASAEGGGVIIYQATIFPKSLTILHDTISCNSSYTFANNVTLNNIFKDTIYDFALPSSTVGCDSLVRTKLHVILPNIINHSDSVCIGTNYTFLDGSSAVITKDSFIHNNVFTAQNGCDSIIKTILKMTGSYDTIVINKPCGSSYIFPNGDTLLNIQHDTLHTSHLYTANGCDSIIVTKINFQYLSQIVINENMNCSENYLFPDGTLLLNIQHDTSYTSYFQNINNCDSIIITNLQINNVHIDINVNICKGASYTFPDGNFVEHVTSNIKHVNYLFSIGGCDSIVTINLKVYNLNTAITQENNKLSANIIIPNYQWYDCFNKKILLGDTNRIYLAKENGNYAVIISNENCIDTSDCYYVSNCNLNPKTISENISCGSNYTFPDFVTFYKITNNTSHISKLTAINGCDSFLTTLINVVGLNKSIIKNNNKLTSQEENVKYQWYDCIHQTLMLYETNKEFVTFFNGNYAVIINNGECIDTSDCYKITSNTKEQEDLINVYPNPTNNILNVEIVNGNNDFVDAKLYNTLGQLVMYKKIAYNQFKVTFDVSSLTKGVYFIKLDRHITKVIIE